MPLQTPAPARRHRFVPLTVTDVEPLTDAAVAVTFALPDEDDVAAPFLAFEPGQHLTLRADIDGVQVRRSYSLCLSRSRALATRTVRVASALVAGGRMSAWLNGSVRPGDTIEVLPPLGTFTSTLRPGTARHHVFVAAGSGITPVLSLLTTALEEEPDATVTLFFGNRTTRDVMFLEELQDLKDAHLERVQIVNVLSREPTDVELLHGRIDAERLPRLLAVFAPLETVDDFFLCGPDGMVQEARAYLSSAGVDPARVHHEVFHVPSQDEPPRRVVVDTSAPPQAVITVNLDGRTSRVEMPTRAESILEATLRVRPDAPFSCTGGVCGTCRARVTAGEVRMDRNYALEPDELAAGIVLACQSHPVTDEVTLDYDA